MVLYFNSILDPGSRDPSSISGLSHWVVFLGKT